MDVQAEINWIRAELKGVKDPYLINALKNLLKYRGHRNEDTVEEYNQDVLAAERRVESGEFVTHEDMLKALDKW